MGMLGEAKVIVQRLEATDPPIEPKVTQFRNPEHRELYLSGLRLATGETE